MGHGAGGSLTTGVFNIYLGAEVGGDLLAVDRRLHVVGHEDHDDVALGGRLGDRREPAAHRFEHAVAHPIFSTGRLHEALVDQVR